MDLMLNDRIALITGPAKGMGAAVTRGFAEEGCRLMLLARDVAAVEPLAEELHGGGTACRVVQTDLTRPDDCARAARLSLDTFGRIDILVNIAGGTGTIGKSGVETTPDEFEATLKLNMGGCFNMIRAVLPAMIERRYGKIVNVGGTFGMRGRAGRLAYSASTWGLRGITKSFALEVGASNINVNYVAPGMVDGPRFRDKVCADMAARLGISVEEAARRHADDYALKRITTDLDVANACLFLASDVSRQLTGVDLPVDGGWAAL
jgi:NAD(P)-dependent dehydrogenase (short-subunit alcohol dehydrogenase family)